ncbi:hypothetical protein AX769_03300 [Frondihabitans sp. PAMC 28766]|uniref:sulfite exporter TauE/SafE family protein n=1 Tax=Frondihabitans sp. PAMC 28766 TaxID=1795630 RepID=UPI00078D28E9|nr:sulfite exporter TauE/SafE family protein [Frondihabitans sp. PAMC 28766]AMM19335.1 hypothetical protein AX769_03300 [Frondihabitans sp. PAMC 28766]
MTGLAEWAFLVAAGIVAGITGTAGGITSLVAYPALLAVGLPPLTANVSSSVALVGSGFSSALSSGPELRGHAPTLRRWMPPVIVMSLAGAVLLVVTPGDVFGRIVPYLVLLGAVALLCQPAIARWQARRGATLTRATVGASGAGVALYNGYFGAGSGILMIALLMLSIEPKLPRANALKNAILISADVLPAVLFIVLGRIEWQATVALGIGALLGGLVGPRVARRVPAALMRVLIAACGFGLAGWLLLHP